MMWIAEHILDMQVGLGLLSLSTNNAAMVIALHCIGLSSLLWSSWHFHQRC